MDSLIEAFLASQVARPNLPGDATRHFELAVIDLVRGLPMALLTYEAWVGVKEAPRGQTICSGCSAPHRYPPKYSELGRARKLSATSAPLPATWSRE